MSTPQEIQEAADVGIFEEASVQAGAIEGASLLGRVSANKRVYSDDALDDAARLYSEGVTVYLDHPESKSKTTRSVRDLAGRVVQAYRAGDRVKGTIQTLNTEPGRLLASIAEQMPDAAGASHRASGKIAVDDQGRQLVTEISDVKSVDIVTRPATVGGLLESIQANAVEREPNLAEIRARLFSNYAAPPPRELLEEIAEIAPETEKADLAEVKRRLFT